MWSGCTIIISFRSPSCFATAAIATGSDFSCTSLFPRRRSSRRCPTTNGLSHSWSYDLVGFQTESDATNFARYLEGECRLQKRDAYTFQSGERTVRIGVFPIGIETNVFNRLARRSARSPLVHNVLDSLAGRAMVIGVDRLDYSKGLAQRMDAFERFLAVYPEWPGKVTYLQITPKSRSQIEEHSDMERTISEAAGRLNGRYGEVAWTPIRYVNRAYNRSVLAGLYRSARAALVTPLRDGMNTRGEGIHRRTGTILEC
jgi:trehalose 6-phosphate synthase